MQEQMPRRDQRSIGARIQHAIKLRQPAPDGLVERQQALIPQPEQRERREHLGDRANAEERAGRHGRAALEARGAFATRLHEGAVHHEAPRKAGCAERPQLLLELALLALGERRDLRSPLGIFEDLAIAGCIVRLDALDGRAAAFSAGGRRGGGSGRGRQRGARARRERDQSEFDAPSSAGCMVCARSRGVCPVHARVLPLV
jgi:hypothetical protein